MKFKDLTEGCYVKWRAIRTFKSWNTFGQITKITEKDFVIITYDDFKSTMLSKNGEALKAEISLVDKEVVDEYIQMQLEDIQIKKLKIKSKAKKQMKDIKILAKKLKAL